jgi:Cu(I)/Ag(I) efflux system membrane fusion protein
MAHRLQKLRNALVGNLGKIGLAIGAFALGVALQSFRGTQELGESVVSGKKEAAAPELTIWTCSMHPQIRQSQPGQCPICGMDLIPVVASDDAESADAAHIELSPRARTLAKIRTSAVARADGQSGELRLLGRVEVDERSMKTVTAWTGGRIDRLLVNVTGERVRAGQTIATLYSPEIFAAHQDLLVAQQQLQKMSQSPESSRLAAQAMRNAARDRLGLLGVPEKELARLESMTQATRSVAIYSPFTGTIIERIASEGAYVTTGAPLYKIANLATVWLQFDAYESDLGKIAVGQRATIHVEALPTKTFEGSVAFIEPTLDARRRTAKVRVVVKNQEQELSPGMFAQATIELQASDQEQGALLIPHSAPLLTGRRTLVYVESTHAGKTSYEAREVQLGTRRDDFYEVVSGLKEGEQVVTRGAFALDADLQIRGGPSLMNLKDEEKVPKEAQASAGSLAPQQREQMASVVQAYLRIHEALAGDDLSLAQASAQKLGVAVDGVVFAAGDAGALFWEPRAKELRAHAQHVGAVSDLKNARVGFEALSETMHVLVEHFGNPTPTTLHRVFCPMANNAGGAYWYQKDENVANAYFGRAMAKCGEVRERVQPLAASSNSKPSGGHIH